MNRMKILSFQLQEETGVAEAVQMDREGIIH